MNKTFKLVPLIALSALLAGCGDNAEVDFEGSINDKAASDYSFLEANILPANTTLIDQETDKQISELLKSVNEHVFRWDLKLSEVEEWNARADQLITQVKEADLGETGNKVVKIIEVHKESVAEAKAKFDSIYSDELAMETLKIWHDRDLIALNKREESLAALDGYGEDVYKKFTTARTSFQNAEKKYKYEFKNAFEAEIHQYIIDNSVPISTSMMRPLINTYNMHKKPVNGVCKKEDKQYGYYVPQKESCYYLSFNYFKRGGWHSLSKEHQDGLLALQGKYVLPKQQSYINYLIEYDKFEAAKKEMKDVDIIVRNKHNTSLTQLHSSINSIKHRIEKRSNGLYNAETGTINKESDNYGRLVTRILENAGYKQSQIEENATIASKDLDHEELFNYLSKKALRDATVVEISSGGSFSIEGENKKVVITSKPDSDHRIVYFSEFKSGDITFTADNGKLERFNNLPRHFQNEMKSTYYAIGNLRHM